MSDVDRVIQAHYGQSGLFASIVAALKRMGKDVNALEPKDLAPVDSFHVRGLAATVELGAHAHLSLEDHVLDVGCGLGGAARHLALTFGCRVTGIDLTPEYVDAGNGLSGLLGLQDRVVLQQGNALELPFADGAFSAAWSEHAQMNIADKPTLYREIHRALRKEGRFLFHDILQGAGGDPHFPTLWAANPEASALIAPADFRRLLMSLGFDIKLWEDKTTEGRDWFRKRVAGLREKGAPPLGIHTLIGAIAPETLENNLRNLEENRIALVQGMVEKVG